MGKIFGISDNPVTTIESSLKVLDRVPGGKIYPKEIKPNYTVKDSFVSKEKAKQPNAFVKMRNGIGKLMVHFSKPKTK